MSTDESDNYCGYRQEKSSIERFDREWDREVFVDTAQWDEDDNTVVCLRDPWTDHDRCIWHAETKDKSADDLIAIRANGPERLGGAYLANVVLGDRFPFAGCWLHGANLSGADLTGADLSEAYLLGADLSEAYLPRADLSYTDLRDANFSDADLRETDLEDISVNGATTCRQLYEGYGDHDFTANLPISMRFWLRRLYRSSSFDPADWDSTARAYHALKTVFDDHGLVGKSRNMYIQERRARSLEAKAAGGWFARKYWGSLLSRIFTGYGVQVRNLMFWMLTLFLVSTAVYVSVGVRDSLMENITYSVLAFTVAPPPPIPSGIGTQFIMMTETFLGTLSIVVFGAMLGKRF